MIVSLILIFIYLQVIILAFFVVAALADTRPIIIPVLERTEKHDDAGQFALRYITGDGITVSETGALKKTLDGKDYVLVKEGEYSYTGPDGVLYRTKYVSDEKGFRAEGAHLPKPVVA